MSDEADDAEVDTCQMGGCDRPATGNFTTTMYAASEGEEWPDDVSERPICWYHHVLDKVVEGGTIGLLFGLTVAAGAWITGATNAAYIHLTLAVIAGLALSVAVGLVRRSEVISRV